MTTRAVRTIDDYLRQLRAALEGVDDETLDEALGLCEEYLRAELAASPHRAAGDVLELICSTYGAPEDVAAVYRAQT